VGFAHSVLVVSQATETATLDLPPNAKNFGVVADIARPTAPTTPTAATPPQPYAALHPIAAALLQLLSPVAAQPAVAQHQPLNQLVLPPRDVDEVKSELAKHLGEADVNLMLAKLRDEALDKVDAMAELTVSEVDQLFAKIGQRKAFKKIFNITN
jgi:hypothetical protein